VKRSERFGAILLALIFVAVVFSISASIFSLSEMIKIQSEIKNLRLQISKVQRDLSDRIGRVEDLIGPNSPLDKYINDLSYVKNLLSDLENIERILSEIPEDPTSGYFRVLVVGSEKVWFEIGKGEKKYFAEELFPGLSKERFYYFKAPNVDLKYIVPVAADSYITIGKPGRVYLIFFGVGVPGKRPVKIVHLENSHYRSLKDDFKLYIPK
jgi:cell division protein FtsL